MAAFVVVPEVGLSNDNSGQVVAVINADTSSALISRGKLPASSESEFVANDNTGNLVAIINADTSTATINNGKLAGPLVDSITGNDGITVTNPSGVGGATLGLSNVPNASLAGPLVSSVAAGTGITVTGNPSGVGSPTVALSSSVVGGAPIIKVRSSEVAVGTTATTIATYTPAAAGLFLVMVFIRAAAATSITVTVTYQNAAATPIAQTDTLLPAGFAAGTGDDYGGLIFFLSASANAIAVSATAGAATSIYASATISQW